MALRISNIEKTYVFETLSVWRIAWYTMIFPKPSLSNNIFLNFMKNTIKIGQFQIRYGSLDTSEKVGTALDKTTYTN